MEKNINIGTPIPRMGDIEKIDGNRLIDKDGGEWDRGTVKANHTLGGGWELCSVDDKEKDPED